jgi:hypothetical protein
MAAIEATRQNLRISQLRAAARTADANKARRILAIAIGRDGHARGRAWPVAWTGRRRATGRSQAKVPVAQPVGMAEGMRSNADGLAARADPPRRGRRAPARGNRGPSNYIGPPVD